MIAAIPSSISRLPARIGLGLVGGRPGTPVQRACHLALVVGAQLVFLAS
ncbi:hypothetical protein [Mesorhizobium qingshengii]|nr:hypothetical protein [Mesorhizobium qingshengii]